MQIIALPPFRVSEFLKKNRLIIKNPIAIMFYSISYALSNVLQQVCIFSKLYISSRKYLQPYCIEYL